MALPIFTTDDKNMNLLQTTWSTQLNPVLSNPISNGRLIQNTLLTVGANNVNHKLGRKLQGWFIVRQRSAAAVYDQQDTNGSPALTLSLTSNANVSVDLYVF